LAAGIDAQQAGVEERGAEGEEGEGEEREGRVRVVLTVAEGLVTMQLREVDEKLLKELATLQVNHRPSQNQTNKSQRFYD
jgi:hypothetical protein